MNRHKRFATALVTLFVFSMAEAGLWAVTCHRIADRRSTSPVPHHQIAFFNGVRTSSEAGTRGSRLLGQLTDGLIYHADVSSALLYNTHENLWFDLIETFAQRIEEANGSTIDRYNLALDIASGRNDLWQDILAENPSLTGFHEGLKSDLNQRMAEALRIRPSEVTQSDYERHQQKLRNWVNNDRELVLVGYSQGNLFANRAYEYLQEAHPEAFVDVVHIAPASTQTYGPHVLADRDLVIKALPGAVPPVNATIPPFAQRPSLPKHGRDFLGHGLLNTYLHPNLDTSYAIEQHLYDAILPKQSEEATFWASIPIRNEPVPEKGRLTPEIAPYFVDGRLTFGTVTVDQRFARKYMKKDCFYRNDLRLYEAWQCADPKYHKNIDMSISKVGWGCAWITLEEPSEPREICFNFGSRHYDGSIHLTAIIDRNGILKYYTEKPHRHQVNWPFDGATCAQPDWIGTELTTDFGVQSLSPRDHIRYFTE